MLRRGLLLLTLGLLLAPVSSAQDPAEELFAAARKGDAPAVKALLEKGVDANAKWRYDTTALFFAADRGHTEVVKVLLEHGATVNVKDTYYGMTPMDRAAGKGHVEVVRMLLEKGADGKDRALTTGVSANNKGLVEVVLEKGGLKAETLSVALDNAERNKRTEIAELLRKAGAVPPPKADFQVDAETLRSYAATYKGPDAELTVVFKDGKLFVQTPGPTLPLGAIDKVTFRPGDLVAITVVFKVEDGKVTGMTVKQGGNETFYKRAEAK